MSSARILYIGLVFALSMPLSGCGIKPKHLEPPADAENNGFPHTYPDIRTDPPPISRP